MSVISIDDVASFPLSFIFNNLKQLKRSNYVQFMNLVYANHYHSMNRLEINPYSQNKILAEYILEDVENDSGNELWWSVCRMLFIEQYLHSETLKDVSITCVSKDDVNYDTFTFKDIEVKHSNNDVSKSLICDGTIHKQLRVALDSDVICELTDKDEDELKSEYNSDDDTDTYIDVNVVNEHANVNSIVNNVGVNNISNNTVNDVNNNNVNTNNVIDYVEEYNKLNDIGKYIVDHIKFFEIGISNSDMDIDMEVAKLGRNLSKYCNRLKMSIMMYYSHIDEHRDVFGADFKPKTKCMHNTSVYVLKNSKYNNHSRLLRNIAKHLHKY